MVTLRIFIIWRGEIVEVDGWHPVVKPEEACVLRIVVIATYDGKEIASGEMNRHQQDNNKLHNPNLRSCASSKSKVVDHRLHSKEPEHLDQANVPQEASINEVVKRDGRERVHPEEKLQVLYGYHFGVSNDLIFVVEVSPPKSD